MIDLILAAVILGAFYGGFKAGNAYKTIGEMVSSLLDKAKSAL